MTMAEIDKNLKKTIIVEDDHLKLKGKYISTVGRRKTATALIRLYRNGTGIIIINGVKASEYFKQEDLLGIINLPLKQSGLTKDFNFTIVLSGGGNKSQAEAVRHGIVRALLVINPELRPSLKVKGWIKRDARKKERTRQAQGPGRPA